MTNVSKRTLGKSENTSNFRCHMILKYDVNCALIGSFLPEHFRILADGMAEFLQKRRLADDVLEYLLIPQLPEGLDENDVVSFLEGICDTYLGYLGPLVIDYIWQNEGFTLRPSTAKGGFENRAGLHFPQSSNAKQCNDSLYQILLVLFFDNVHL